MSEFNERNWLDALSRLYERATTNSEFRSLCLADPVAAVAQVSDIELPPSLKLRFFDNRQDFLYAFLLPPATTNLSAEDQKDQLIRWATFCTEYTTG